jgi:hypothetical protein
MIGAKKRRKKRPEQKKRKFGEVLGKNQDRFIMRPL